MQSKAHPLFWVILVAQVMITAVFLAPTFMFYQQPTGRTLLTAAIAFAAAALILFAWQKLPIGASAGNQLAKTSAAFWGMGWAIMVLFEPQVGWWIFMGGWVGLTLGLFLVGANDYHKRNPLGYAIVPLFAGIWPLVMELSTEAFTTQIAPFVQIQIMFLFTAGWVLHGVVITHNEVPELATLTQRFSSTEA